MSAIPWRRIEGKYEILEKLGEGGMGAVYKVRHRLLDDVRVIKMMRPQLVAEEEFKARFQREARVATQLRHPNVARLIDFTIDDEDGTASIVMEFIDGMTLEQVLHQNGPPSLGLAIEIAQQSLRALTCLHEKGFVHRDISPDNLMLTEDDGRPLVKLIDLGIAKIREADSETAQGQLTRTGIFLGKIRYSPPEQFGPDGAANVDARGDLYSLGVVFYQLLTGRYPIQGNDSGSLMAGHLFHPPVDFATSDPEGRVPPELRDLILKTLAKEPAKRFASARELERALAALRYPGDVDEGDLKRALARKAGAAGPSMTPPPGSTQDRLDLQFGLQTTPSRRLDDGQAGTLSRRDQELELRIQTLLRETDTLLNRGEFEEAMAHLERGRQFALGKAEALELLARADARARERWRAHDLERVQEEIEAALARADYRGAEMRLYQAEATFGDLEVFILLHEQLLELRRRDLEARKRAERLAAAARQIEEQIAKGAREQAERLLDETGAAFGDDPALAALRVHLDFLRREASQAEAAALTESTMRLRDEDDLPAALAEARRALDLDPDNPEARTLAEGIAAEISRREEEARRREREAEIAAEIAALLARSRDLRREDDLDGSLRTVRQIFSLDEGNTEARVLVEEIEAERRRQEEEARRLAREAEIAAEIAALLARARELREGDDLEGSLQEASKVFSLDKGNAEAQALVEEIKTELRRREEEAAEERRRRAAEIEAELRRQEAEAEAERRRREAEAEAERRRREMETQRAEQLAAALASIDACLDQGDPDAAARLVPGIVAIFGDAPDLRDRWERIEELRARKTQERVDFLLAQARRLQGGGELEAALGAMRAAGGLLPNDPDVRALAREIEEAIRGRDEESRQERELETALATLDEAMEKGDLAAVARLLPAAVSRFGGAPALRERWERLETLQRKARVDALRGEAAALAEAGYPDRAARKLRQALEIDPGNRAIQGLLSDLSRL